MTNLTFNVIQKLNGRTLVTAESCTGGGIGATLTAVPGSSSVYKGGIISYTNDVKEKILRVEADLLEKYGAVSAQVAERMAIGVRNLLGADVAVSVTGLAGPSGDDRGNPIGTVYVGYSDYAKSKSFAFHFVGDREEVRSCAVRSALEVVLNEI